MIRFGHLDSTNDGPVNQQFQYYIANNLAIK